MAKKTKFKFGINTLINWGATVVIIGLMFKILHLKGGEWMIGVGLAVEALLFFIMGFMQAEQEPDWTRVYPELDEDYNGELPTRSVRAVAQPVATGNTAALDKLLQDAKIDENLIGNLGDGLRTFSDKVASISKVADTAVATNQFADKLNAASTGAAQLSNAFERAASDLQTFNESAADMQQFKEQVSTFNKNLSSLNAIYGNMLSAMNTNRS
ncbi:type IX secretion system motor protein PorL/GldL [Sphingobacterium wenxiniae]|uniref:Gliding motility-associated protein GldL n=1 Tax=Sphingobacterium wenxiniae TaxID=683125 RepID=A0A1I6R6J4_9SPHI|nr:gliding motility protein GldL [Sphingobacterium wenxiniae]7SAX_C Chain C, GldL [Sphingobacterium wenxiniae]7SAX_D Chain D, GldL [Sphingobacterium wenxiniae]7SAX_E Chain E, GldL [Sphingobacterium wenxiniae]7SAX_F Chain F, GldL [Sphingobacterium wenxiniae]7SAX_G Chain G, GldL [Sphingobacterium wenxiniae]SFS60284.1 gliding motility-associated protein GldL [Sphingobacterium wenxiniae]